MSRVLPMKLFMYTFSILLKLKISEKSYQKTVLQSKFVMRASRDKLCHFLCFYLIRKSFAFVAFLRI